MMKRAYGYDVKVDLMNGDLVFKRAANGWIIERVVDNGDSERLEVTIYEDADHVDLMENVPTHPEAQSLTRAINEEFNQYSQSKHHPGFKIRYSNKGREREEEDQFMDYSLDDILEKREEIDEYYKDAGEDLKEMAENKKESIHVAVIKTTDDGECFVEIPQELLEQLDWVEGDDLQIEETEFWDTHGEYKGFSVANLTKNPEAKVNNDENNKP